MDKKIKFFSEKDLELLTQLHAQIAWIIKGSLLDDNSMRLAADWYQAKQIVGFKLGDNILQEFRENYFFPIPKYYNKYLKKITIDEYKRYKAYFIWLDKYGTEIDYNSSVQNYLEACSYLPNEESLKHKGKLKDSSPLLDYINATNKVKSNLEEINEQQFLDSKTKPSILYVNSLSSRALKSGEGKIFDIKKVLKKGIDI